MAACDGLLSKPEKLAGRLAIREATAEVVSCSAVATAGYGGFRYGRPKPIR